MKLELLVVVAVAVLLPSFSESRIVSKCELKDKLRKSLPRRLEESVLATIICEVNRLSHLNTSLVNVFGKRITTTLKPTVVTSPSTTAVTKKSTGATTLTNTNSTTTDLTSTTATTTSTATTATTTSTATTATTTSTTATTVTTTSPAITDATISSVNTPTTLVSNSTGGMKRRKRHADSSSEEEMGQISGEMGDSSEEDAGQNTKPLSLGFYGLFQLSDSLFCDSGYRPTRNVCRTSCNSFTDDNITDDIACFINTGYWRNIVTRASRSCRNTMNFFKECK